MALSADTPRAYEYNADPLFTDLPVKASSTIYEGGAVGDDASGYMRALVSGDPFRGFAERGANNSTGAAAALNVKLRQQGFAQLTVVNASAVTDVGQTVYATADGTFTLVPGGTRIGIIVRWVTSTTCIVFFQGEQVRGSTMKGMVVAKTAAYTVAPAADNGKVFTTKGATASVTFTLPAPADANAGTRVEFVAGADQVMIVSGTANKMVTFNDLDADGVTFSTAGEKIGAHVVAISDGEYWFVSKLGAHTMTVAT